MMDYYLGLDAGGTHTRSRLVSGDGAILGIGEAGPANTPSGLPRTLLAIEEACALAVTQAGLTAEVGSIRVGMGIAGLNRRGFLDGLKAHDFGFASVAFASDAAIANLGAHGGGDGATVIVGTGSVGFSRVGESIFTIGGYGFPVSDEGSGAELGLRSIRRALWARDGRIPHTPMTLELLEQFHGSAGEIVDWTAGATPKDYAVFAPMVMDYAMQSEPTADIIVREAAQRIEAIITTLLDRGAPSCCVMGGVGVRMREWLAPSIRERLREPLGDALDGAILLARTRAGPV